MSFFEQEAERRQENDWENLTTGAELKAAKPYILPLRVSSFFTQRGIAVANIEACITQYSDLRATADALHRDMYQLTPEQIGSGIVFEIWKKSFETSFRTIVIPHTIVQNAQILLADEIGDRWYTLMKLAQRRKDDKPPLTEFELWVLEKSIDPDCWDIPKTLVPKIPPALKEEDKTARQTYTKIRETRRKLYASGELDKSNLQKKRRKIQEVKQTQEGSMASSIQIGASLHVPDRTVRYDLQKLREEGRLAPVHKIEAYRVHEIVISLQKRGLSWERGEITNAMLTQEYGNNITESEMKNFCTRHRDELALPKRNKHAQHIAIESEVADLIGKGITDTREIMRRTKRSKNAVTRALKKLTGPSL